MSWENADEILERALRLQAKIDFERSVDIFLDEVSDASPEDTGSLIHGLKARVTDTTGNVLKAKIESTTTDEGFDYPDHLNKVSQMKPTKAKFLTWPTGNGGYARSRGFANKHKGWWTKAVTGPKWNAALRRGFRD